MNRRQNSGGQAIILVTLALLAMCGMMGLAVDMGWSFFVHKQAQTAADAAALGAVEEAYKRIGGNGVAISAFTCAAGGGTGATQADCRTAAVPCATVIGTGSNLDNGCQYAKKNGFDWAGSRQGVTIQSNDGLTADLPPTAPGITNLTYWVTVRTVQTVPQLFSAVGKNSTEGTVSAVATAALAASIGPGQFYGMNRKGDCLGMTVAADGTLGTGGNCGVDYTGAPGNGAQTDCGSGKANLCAPAGIILSSMCNGAGTGCTGVAGDGVAMGASLTIMGDGSKAGSGSVTGSWQNMQGNNLLPCSSGGGGCTYSMDLANTFADPLAKDPQPPMVSELNPIVGQSGPPQYPAIGSCGYSQGKLPGTTLGALQYYSYDATSSVTLASGAVVHPADGKQLIAQGTTVFSNSVSGAAACPGGQYIAGQSQSSSNFPTYIFYGGVNFGSSTVTMNAGQYVMAGAGLTQTLTQQPYVMDLKGATITGDATAALPGANRGTMWVLTDGNYPGMAAQLATVPNSTIIQSLMQGSVNMSSGSPNITLSGLLGSGNNNGMPAGLDSYAGIAWWQDRRNSDVGYNEDPSNLRSGSDCPDCTGDTGKVLYCMDASTCQINSTAELGKLLADNHVTATSPGLVIDPGAGNIAINGVFYQPRGAWLDYEAGNAGFTCPSGQGKGGGPSQCPLEVVTGALLLQGKGTVGLELAGPTNPIITYRPVLIH